MSSAQKLFKDRLISHFKLLNRYLRYLFLGNFMVSIAFAVVALIIQYQKWLQDLNNDFPSSFVMALVLGAVVSYNPIQTFLKKPDEVFLIVKETNMYQYFCYALVYSYLFQLYVVVIAMAAIGPLYIHIYGQTGNFLVVVLLTLVIKGLNLAAKWMMFKLRNKQIVFWDKFVRTLLGFGIFYTLFEGKVPFIFLFLFAAIIVIDYVLARRHLGLAWDKLIENDKHRLALFYRFVSNFAEVPQLSSRLKKQRLLAKLIEHQVLFKQSHTFHYLYRLTFIRSSYFDLYVRLTIVGAVIMFFMPNSLLQIPIALLFLYMTSFQLVPLFHHHRTSIWMDLYPVKQEDRKNAYLKDMRWLTVIQTAIFSLVFLIWLDVISLFIMFIGGCLFTYLFYNNYVKKKIA